MHPNLHTSKTLWEDKGNWVGRVTAFSGFSAQVQLVCGPSPTALLLQSPVKTERHLLFEGRSEWFDVESLLGPRMLLGSWVPVAVVLSLPCMCCSS